MGKGSRGTILTRCGTLVRRKAARRTKSALGRRHAVGERTGRAGITLIIAVRTIVPFPHHDAVSPTIHYLAIGIPTATGARRQGWSFTGKEVRRHGKLEKEWDNAKGFHAATLSDCRLKL